MEPYCPECGKNHPTFTGGCPYKNERQIPMVYPNNFQAPEKEEVIKKLNRIIELLEKMEYYLRTQK
jgi:hypothetical protein